MPTPTLSQGAASATRLQSRAYAELRRLIVSGEFPPGTFLSERQLASQLQMSKTPVHVALERLEAEGFVTISAQQGIVVRGLSVEDILDHYELREAIETYVTGKLAGRLNQNQQAQLRESLRQQEAALSARDVAALMDLDARFHLLLMSFLGNHQITATMEQLRDKIHQVILRVTSVDHNRLHESVEEHAKIVDALVQGDAAAASRLAVDHLEAGKQRILNPNRFPRA
jgi:DNA-binding GntR family transcriptional regulator